MASPSVRGGRSGGGGSKLSSGNASSWRSSHAGTGDGAAAGGAQAKGSPAPQPQPGSRWASGPPKISAEASRPGQGGNAKSGQKPAGGDAASAAVKERVNFVLTSLVGTTVVATKRGGAKFVGILSSTSVVAGELGAVLSCAQEILSSSGSKDKTLGPVQRTLTIPGKDLDDINASEVRLGEVQPEAKERAGFRTDTQISKIMGDGAFEGRALQKWSDDDPEMMSLESSGPSAGGSARGWDQFAANEAKFGVKSDYQETLYTTKLDKSGKNFKEKERAADKLAREILSGTTDNPHLAEERNLAATNGAEPSEEDRYGAVVRGPNAYVPPAMRKAAAAGGAAASTSQPPAQSSNPAPGPDAASNGADATSVPVPAVQTQAATPTLPDAADASAGASGSINATQKAEAEFRDFVVKERERLEKKKQALAKKEKDTRLADLKSWASSFKLKTPTPDDVPGVVAKDGTTGGAQQKSLSPTTAHVAAGKANGQAAAATPGTKSVMPSPSGGSGSAKTTGGPAAAAAPAAPAKSASLAHMMIPKIPPFNPEKARARQAAAAAAAAGGLDAAAKPSAPAPAAAAAAAAAATPSPSTATTAVPSSTSTNSFKLSARASAFKPFNPSAAAFTPGAAPAKKPDAAPSPVASTSAVPALPTAPSNPFFGSKVIKKHANPLHVREDFNPFKASKVPEASAIGPMWAFTGKPYRQLFAAIPLGVALHPAGMSGPGMMPPFEGVEGAPLPVGAVPPSVFGTPSVTPAIPHLAAPLPGGAQPPLPPTPQQQHSQQHPQQQQQQPPLPHGQSPHSGPPGGPPPGQQPYGMVYPPYAPYRFPGQQQQMHMPMPQGGPMPYGGVPPQFMGQMPFSPPMPAHGGPPMYGSPQMANMPGPGHFIPGGPGGPGGPAGQPAGPAGAGNPQRPGPMPPHMQQGKMPPQMYYGQPMPGMAYPSAPFAPGQQNFRPGAQPPHPGAGGGEPANQH